jgi:hypothetical protein
MLYHRFLSFFLSSLIVDILSLRDYLFLHVIVIVHELFKECETSSIMR